jgi:hypothetical protein
MRKRKLPAVRSRQVLGISAINGTEEKSHELEKIEED